MAPDTLLKTMGTSGMIFRAAAHREGSQTNPTAVHLFLGSWVKSATGVLSEVREIERWAN